MTAKDFLIKILEQAPSRGLDNTEIYLHSIDNNGNYDSYRIIYIDNEGCNDTISIEIKKE